MLITLSMIIPAVLLLAGGVLTFAWTDSRAALRAQATTQALFLAEAGVDQALVELRNDYDWGGGEGELEQGEFSIEVESLPDNRRRILVVGMDNTLGATVSRTVEVIVEKVIPPDFYDNVIWASENLDFKGSSFSVTGKVRHGDKSPTNNTGGVVGPVTYDPKTDPLPKLSYNKLYEMAQAQGNVYDAERLGNSHGVFPTSFWYQEPTDPSDPTTGIPNINYVTTDLVLNGNIGTIGGFFVVVGDVITNPLTEEDTTINGNGQIAGAIYSRGNFRVNGGGNGLNVDGGVWAGKEARLNGNVTMTYDWDYMHAIQALDINPELSVISWRESESAQE
jgi:hypothetical protein